MSKIRKENLAQKAKVQQAERQKTMIKLQMFNSAKITYIIAFIFFIISFLFNGLIISPWVELVENSVKVAEGPTFLGVIDTLIKSFSIILFFLFTFISLGNYQELRGYIMTWKEMTVLVVLTLAQATINGDVFIISALGIVIIVIYMFFIQVKVIEEY